MAARACVLGCAGSALDDEERALFRDLRPWGFILFARNIVDADQVRRLTAALREAIDDEQALVFVDQEGGRVQRLRPPLARRRAPAARFGSLYNLDRKAAREAVWLNHRLIAQELSEVGIDADCAPCLDVLQPRTHAVIGDRAFASDPEVVADLGIAAVGGLLAGGVAPVVKHLPGHGAAANDSHVEAPRVEASRATLAAVDLAPFRAVAHAPIGMTAHVVYSAIDPERCATMSPFVIAELIRGHIGFDGLLMSDDLSMRALQGPLGERSASALAAGCDIVLHGNGALIGEPVRDLATELRQVAAAAPQLAGAAATRAAAAREASRRVVAFDRLAAEARLEALGVGASVV